MFGGPGTGETLDMVVSLKHERTKRLPVTRWMIPRLRYRTCVATSGEPFPLPIEIISSYIPRYLVFFFFFLFLFFFLVLSILYFLFASLILFTMFYPLYAFRSSLLSTCSLCPVFSLIRANSF